MSSVNDVISFIETNIVSVIPAIKQSPNYYNVGDNDNLSINHSYSVRPGNAGPISGTTNSATYEQEFEIEITRRYNDSRSGDSNLRSVIETLYIDHQTITKQLSLRRSAPILIVGVPSKSAPAIDEKNKFVSIIFNYPIQYREVVKGV